MDDTDRLVAGIFAAAMIMKRGNPTTADFWRYFDECMTDAAKREAVAKADRKAAAQKRRSTTAARLKGAL